MAYHAERVRFHTVGKNPFRQPTDSDHSGWPSYGRYTKHRLLSRTSRIYSPRTEEKRGREEKKEEEEEKESMEEWKYRSTRDNDRADITLTRAKVSNGDNSISKNRARTNRVPRYFISTTLRLSFDKSIEYLDLDITFAPQ